MSGADPAPLRREALNTRLKLRLAAALRNRRSGSHNIVATLI